MVILPEQDHKAANRENLGTKFGSLSQLFMMETTFEAQTEDDAFSDLWARWNRTSCFALAARSSVEALGSYY